MIAAVGMAEELPEPGAPSGNGVQPEVLAGNPTCADAGYSFGFKIDDPTDGTFLLTSAYGSLEGGALPDPGNSITLTNVTGSSLDWSSTLGIDAVLMKGGPYANLYAYSPEAHSDTAVHPPLNKDSGSFYGTSHVTFCYDYEVDVTKDAHTSYTRTWDWDITKTVDPATHALFAGDSADSTYTVTVDKTGFTDSNWAVEGTISIVNNSPFDAVIAGVADLVSPDVAATVDCGVTLPHTIPAWGSMACSYETPLPDGSARVNTATVTTTGVVGGGVGTADVVFGDPTEIVDAEVSVTDTNGESWGPVPGWAQWTYPKTFACSSDPLDYVEGGHYAYGHDNTATIVETGDDDAAHVDVDCYAPIVTKDAATTYTRTWDWDITKTVDPATHALFAGDSADSTYTVTVDKTGFTDSDWAVAGTITVANPHPTDSMTVDVADMVSGGIAATVDCGGGSTMLTVGAEASGTCSYAADLPDGEARTNTATATLNDIDFTGIAAVTFGDPSEVVDDEVNVTDTNGMSWGPVSGYAEWTYTGTFACSSDPLDYVEGGHYAYGHDNTATIVETGDDDAAHVDVDCYAPIVSKTVDESFTRTWDWEVMKEVVGETSITINAGQAYEAWWKVVATATGFTDSDWAVAGTIKVVNPHPSADMTVALTDVLDDGTVATLDCAGSLVVPAGGMATCDYAADDPEGDATENTATATLNKVDFATTEPIVYDTPTKKVNWTVVIDDVFNNGAPYVLGTATVDESPKPFRFSTWLSTDPSHDPDVLLECGDTRIPNHVDLYGYDDEVRGEWLDDADAYIDVYVNCGFGCTLTQGYWKTHSAYGPAPYDDTWAQIGEDTMFFLSGQSYYQVLWTPPKNGNGYYILAHQYIAAELNMANGADGSAIAGAFADATALFNTYTPDEAGALKGQDRKAFTDLASILASYNEGAIGPGHCDEDGNSAS